MEDSTAPINNFFQEAIDKAMEEALDNDEATELLNAIRLATMAARTAYHTALTEDVNILPTSTELAGLLAEEAFGVALETKLDLSRILSLGSEDEQLT